MRFDVASLSSLVGGRLAELAGLTHDLGKFLVGFQASIHGAVSGLQSAHKKDAVRHEWGSYVLLSAIFDALGANKAAPLSLGDLLLQAQALDKKFVSPFIGLSSLRLSVLYAVATHHRLPTYDRDPEDLKIIGVKPAGLPSNNDVLSLELDGRTKSDLETEYGTILLGRIRELVVEMIDIDRQLSSGGLDLMGLAEDVRDALIMSDYVISSVDYGDAPNRPEPMACAANTRLGPDGARTVNQPLLWHLANVGSLAAFIFDDIVLKRRPVKTDNRAEDYATHLAKVRASTAYEWQNRGVDFLREKMAPKAAPNLILNVGATGSGKTLSNQKFAAVSRPNGAFRMTAAFDMRVLTTDAQKSYSAELESMTTGASGCLAMLTGDEKIPYLLQPEEPIVIIAGSWVVVDQPEQWRAIWASKSPTSKAITEAPILVSTLDYIVPAGDPSATIRYLDAKLRLRDSTLIIDEIDLAQDGAALACVVRLIYVAGLCGSNVIVSSATMPKPLASAVAEAYLAGQKRRGTTTVDLFIISSEMENFHKRIKPGQKNQTTEVKVFCFSSLEKVGAAVAKKPDITRAKIIDITKREDVYQASINTIIALGTTWSESWPRLPVKVKLSFGCLRFARTRTVVEVARWLSTNWGQTAGDDLSGGEDTNGHYRIVKGVRHYLRVCAYYSYVQNDRRGWMESAFSEILNRKKGNGDVLATLIEAGGLDTKALESVEEEVIIHYVVVASPIVETGRDYDFDYGQLEPSSAGSTVQMPGRINRHRRRTLKKTAHNIHILSKNLEAFKEKNPHKAFMYPGLGTIKTHKESDLNKMLPIDKGLVSISSALRFNTSAPAKSLAASDDASIENTYDEKKDHVTRTTFATERGSRPAFDAAIFRENNLRQEQCSVRITRSVDKKGHVCFLKSSPDTGRKNQVNIETRWEPTDDGSHKGRNSNTWLSERDWTKKLQGQEYHGHVDIPIYDINNLSREEDKISYDIDFGFYRKS